MKRITSFFLCTLITWACKPGDPPIPEHIPTATVSTLAGSSVSGFVNDTGLKARLDFPIGIVATNDGIVYACSNNSIRTITTTTGVVTLLAGSSFTGSANGTGASARFKFLGGIATGPSGNIYVADFTNCRIRKITPDGVVTTLAGSSGGFAEGTGTAAKFNGPTGVAVDANENVFVVDQFNNRIRKITPAGEVTTVAGTGVAGFADGTGNVAQFNLPGGIAIDKNGILYVGDGDNHRIRSVAEDGSVSTIAGTDIAGFANGKGSAAILNRPIGIVPDNKGNLYFTDTNNNRIRKVDAEGVVTTVAGTGIAGFRNGPASEAQFSQPFGVALDAQGSLYVTDTYNNCVRKITIQ